MLPSMSRTVTSPIRRSWMLRVLIFVLQYLQSEEVFSNDRFGAPDCWSAIFQGESRADTWSALSQSENLSASHCLDSGSLVECGIGKLECLDRRRSVEHI